MIVPTSVRFCCMISFKFEYHILGHLYYTNIWPEASKFYQKPYKNINLHICHHNIYIVLKNYLVVLLLVIVVSMFYGWTYKRIFHGVLRYTFYTQTDVNKRKLLKPRKHEVMRTPIYLFSFSLLLINRSYFSCDRTYFSLPP